MDPPTLFPTTSPSTTSTTTTTTSSSSSSTTTTTTATSPTTSSPTTTDSSSTTSSTSSSTTTSLPSTTSQATTLSTSSGGGVITLTSQTTITPTIIPTATPSGSNSGTSTGFFANKGAVAGVFTVVGLVGLAIVIAAVTNIIRRRRARRFDQEIAEAAEEAAKAPAPVFLDDDGDNYGPGVVGAGYAGGRGRGDYDDYNHGAGYTGGGPYSDVSSHGTYSQPPMTTGEAYNMHDLSSGHGGGAPGELYNPYAGAAGVGVARARSTRDPGNFASGLTEGSSPYAAFAGPGYNQQQQGYNGYNNNNAYGTGAGYNRGPGGPEYNLLDAAGMNGKSTSNSAGAAAAAAAVGAAVAAAGVHRGISLSHQPEGQNPYTGPQRSQSNANRSGDSAYSASVYTTPSANYPGGAGAAGPVPPLPHQEPYGNSYGGVDHEDPYGGYAGDKHSQSGHGHPQHLVGGDSDVEDDNNPGSRVLRVANE